MPRTPSKQRRPQAEQSIAGRPAVAGTQCVAGSPDMAVRSHDRSQCRVQLARPLVERPAHSSPASSSHAQHRVIQPSNRPSAMQMQASAHDGVDPARFRVEWTPGQSMADSESESKNKHRQVWSASRQCRAAGRVSGQNRPERGMSVQVRVDPVRGCSSG